MEQTDGILYEVTDSFGLEREGDLISQCLKGLRLHRKPLRSSQLGLPHLLDWHYLALPENPQAQVLKLSARRPALLLRSGLAWVPGFLVAYPQGGPSQRLPQGHLYSPTWA